MTDPESNLPSDSSSRRSLGRAFVLLRESQARLSTLASLRPDKASQAGRIASTLNDPISELRAILINRKALDAERVTEYGRLSADVATHVARHLLAGDRSGLIDWLGSSHSLRSALRFRARDLGMEVRDEGEDEEDLESVWETIRGRASALDGTREQDGDNVNAGVPPERHISADGPPLSATGLLSSDQPDIHRFLTAARSFDEDAGGGVQEWLYRDEIAMIDWISNAWRERLRQRSSETSGGQAEKHEFGREQGLGGTEGH